MTKRKYICIDKKVFLIVFGHKKRGIELVLLPNNHRLVQHFCPTFYPTLNKRRFTPYNVRPTRDSVRRVIDFCDDGDFPPSDRGERFERFHLTAGGDLEDVPVADGSDCIQEAIVAQDVQERSPELLLPMYCGGAEADGTPIEKLFEFANFDRRASVMHTVHLVRSGIPHPGDGALEKLGTIKRSKGGGLLVFGHAENCGTHYHVLHGCSLAGGRCQCFKSGGWLNVFGYPVGKPLRYRSNQFCLEHTAAIWVHCLEGKGGRALLFAQLSRTSEHFLCRIQDLPSYWQGPFPLSRSCLSEFGFNDAEESGAANAGLLEKGGDFRLEEEQKVNSVSSACNFLREISKRYWLSDFSSLLAVSDVMLKEDLQKVLMYNMLKVQQYMNNVFTLEYNIMRNQSFSDFRNTLNSNNVAFGEGFMSREDSFNVLKLMFSTVRMNDLEAAKLIILFRKWFDRELGKKNTIILIGEPSCGKTWLAKAWMKLACYWGKITEWSKGNQFIFSGCCVGRIILHDECIQPIEDNAYSETLKKIYAGECCPISVKYQSGQLSCGAPVIGTCNSFPIRNRDAVFRQAFDERITFLDWHGKEAMDSANIYGECNPRALFDLVDWAEDQIMFFDPSEIFN
ncbi:hypothetical protein DAPPUDRAFT_339705 [Daphnia pulex]|uniref:Parvovirus non-structural protein 1 helicase domain-containing protein n=1 Tax=Daphnia pulex TaxID=6669 RepID=E9I3L8_DAPPU|nr:hypothetical protein DAPPUDRAFT_339705 [Daphnia pulex]|eukprot:EFX61411.1 hypothetical protein DAPPUDRAFT_339705 [Daphnia pulex]